MDIGKNSCAPAEVDYRQLAMRLAAVVWSKGCCPECGFGKEQWHAPQCSQSYEKMAVYSRDIEPAFIEAFEAGKAHAAEANTLSISDVVLDSLPQLYGSVKAELLNERQGEVRGTNT